jgi:hypothetical protein
VGKRMVASSSTSLLLPLQPYIQRVCLASFDVARGILDVNEVDVRGLSLWIPALDDERQVASVQVQEVSATQDYLFVFVFYNPSLSNDTKARCCPTAWRSSRPRPSSLRLRKPDLSVLTPLDLAASATKPSLVTSCKMNRILWLRASTT